MFARRHRRLREPRLPAIELPQSGFCDLDERAAEIDGRFVLSCDPQSLLIVGGLPGAGKAQLAARLHLGRQATVFHLDPLIQERMGEGMGISEAAAEAEQEITEGIDAADGPVVVVAPAVYKKRIAPYLAVAERTGRSPRCLFINADAEECRRRWESSGRPLIDDRSWQAYANVTRKRLEALARGEKEELYGLTSLTAASPETLERLGQLRFEG